MQLLVGVSDFLAGFCRNKNQRGLIATVFQMAVNGVVTQVCFPAFEPLGKRRVAVVTNFLGRFVPLNVLGLLSPESIAILNRTLVKICILNHVVS